MMGLFIIILAFSFSGLKNFEPIVPFITTIIIYNVLSNQKRHTEFHTFRKYHRAQNLALLYADDQVMF